MKSVRALFGSSRAHCRSADVSMKMAPMIAGPSREPGWASRPSARNRRRASDRSDRVERELPEKMRDTP